MSTKYVSYLVFWLVKNWESHLMQVSNTVAWTFFDAAGTMTTQVQLIDGTQLAWKSERKGGSIHLLYRKRH